MKIAPVLAAALIIYIAIPGSIQGKGKKPKPKFCTGKDGNNYKKGESYEDKKACIRYTCMKKGNKFKMKEEKIKCTEPESDLAANVTAIEASVHFLNGSMKSMETKMEALQTNVESLQTSVESILGMLTAMQSTSSKHETCLGDVNSTDCPSSEEGKISVVDAIKGNKEDIKALEKEDIEALEKPKFNLALIAGSNSGGNSGGDLATSEIIGPGGVCSQDIPPLPEDIRGTKSVYFNNTLMVCGGRMNLYQNECHQLHDSNSNWTEGPAMNTPRAYFSITKAGQHFYALGGRDGGGYLDSMEKLSESSGEWTMMAQKLSSPRISHCTVFMETTGSLVIIGGHPYTNLVEEFSIATATWKELAPLPVALYGHGCMVLGNSILVTGGKSNSGAQKTVYTFAGGQWATTGELQEPTYYHSMGTLDNKVLVLGGYAGGYMDTIEEMQQDGSFRKMELKLKEKRAYSAATQVPREKFPC